MLTAFHDVVLQSNGDIVPVMLSEKFGDDLFRKVGLPPSFLKEALWVLEPNQKDPEKPIAITVPATSAQEISASLVILNSDRISPNHRRSVSLCTNGRLQRVTGRGLIAFSFGAVAVFVVTMTNLLPTAVFGLENEIRYLGAVAAIGGFAIGALFSRRQFHRRVWPNIWRKIAVFAIVMVVTIIFGLLYLRLWGTGGLPYMYIPKILTCFGVTVFGFFFLLGFAGFIPTKNETTPSEGA